MKNRILSFVLALVMVLALVPATVLTSSAAGGEKITFTFGNTTAVPGEVAGLDLYVEISNLPEGHTGLVDYEFSFELSEDLVPVRAPAEDGQEEKQEFLTADGSVTTNGYISGSDKKMGVTGGTARVATTEAMTAKGGAYLGTIKFVVSEDAQPGTTLTVVGTSMITASYKHETNAETTKISDDAVVSFVAGTITVVDAHPAETYAPGDKSTVEGTFVVPTTSGNKVVTSLANPRGTAGKYTGTYETFVVPAQIATIAEATLKEATITNLVLKNTGYDTTQLSFLGALADQAVAVEKVLSVYYHKRASGQMDSTKASAVAVIDNYNAEGESFGLPPVDVNFRNILDTTGAEPVVVGDSVSVYGAIEINDLEYNYLTVEVSFYQNGTLIKKIESKEQTCVYTTLKNGQVTVGSTSADAVGSTGITQNDGTYLAGLTVTGVPSGTYQVQVVVYGSTNDVNGTSIIVCSDPAEYTVTVA